MKIPKIKRFVKVQVNYKSGISRNFLCSEFNIKGRGLSWQAYGLYRPVDIALSSVDDIESIWQTGSALRIVWE